MLTRKELMSYNSSKPLSERLKMYTVDENGCWNWNLKKDRCGYGRFKIQNRSLGAHKVSYVYHKGDVEDGLVVMHSCDNPACINPDHLIKGTQKENIWDCIKKGRFYTGHPFLKARKPKSRSEYVRPFNVTPVIAMKGNQSVFFQSYVDAGRYFGMRYTSIHRAANRENNFYNGWHWFKASEFL